MGQAKPFVAVIDYGMGNVRSVAGAIEKVGAIACVSNQCEELRRADALILPGVGAFGDGMENLRRYNLTDMLNELVINKKTPILGICLGWQLMARESFEFGRHQGLGWINASVEKLPSGEKMLRIPHVGWDNLKQRVKSALFNGIPCDALFYYVHSYHVSCVDSAAVIGTCEYGVEFTAVLQQDHICATQFHPEKSQQYGLRLLENFLALC